MIRRCTAVLLASGFSASLSAQDLPPSDQSTTVRGVVVDALNGARLPAALVLLEEESRGTLTDSLGTFVLEHVPLGAQLISVRQYGYEYQSFLASVSPAPAPEIRFELTPKPAALEGFSVVADRLATMGQRLQSRRRAFAFATRTFDQERLVNSAAVDLREFLMLEANLYMLPCSLGSTCVIRRGRLTAPRVYIDEMPTFGVDQLGTYRPHELYLLEVYSQGREIRAYTHQFMDRMARRPMALIPLNLW